MIIWKKSLTGAYEHIAEDFAQTRQRDWGEFNFFKKHIQKGDKLLDLGCGNGRAIPFWQKLEASVIGMDSSQALLEIARQNYPQIKFVYGSMSKLLPFPDEHFDVVVLIASFHHLLSQKERRKALAEIHRILKPKGKLLMTNWNLYPQAKYAPQRRQARWRSLLPGWHKRDFIIPFGTGKIPRFYHSFNPRKLEQLLENNFFQVEQNFGTKGNEKKSFNKAQNICTIATKKNRTKVCGIPFDLISKTQALNKIFDLSKNGRQDLVFTPNPEMCVAASHNTQFKKVLNKATLSLADGSGIIWALSGKSLLRFLFSSKKIGNFERSQGSDLFREFCAQSSAKIFLLGGAQGAAQKCAEIFNIPDYDDGSADNHDTERICQKINQSGAEVLFVAFGAPKQEMWLDQHIKKLPNIHFAMGVGGSFDFVAGKQKRAPKVMRSLGLEWLYRLMREPKRIKRIWRATFQFWRLVHQD